MRKLKQSLKRIYLKNKNEVKIENVSIYFKNQFLELMGIIH